MHRVTPPQLQDLAFPFVELLKILAGLFLQLAEVPLQGKHLVCWCVKSNPNPTPPSFAITWVQADTLNLPTTLMVLL